MQTEIDIEVLVVDFEIWFSENEKTNYKTE